ncbi:O-antigen ligase family protein [Helicobacter sp. 11S02596-1]|uniref:O-antigen ligase family protein n=1 Tax=Helicobacter sp. 11S02596-1 TaxID=1476194 RepID=UPI000BA76AF1|nr:O-antigen ligase family protein [Helicobacter sp. 11S02596-1]PAF42809.1 hypothetical protein BJI48_06015 [Helicobacter sp. 11S02596-1]
MATPYLKNPDNIALWSVIFLAVAFFTISINTHFLIKDTILAIGGLLYLGYLYQNGFKIGRIFRELHPIRFWIFSFLGVVAMALISLHFAFDSIATLKAIGQFLILPLILALFFYLVAKTCPPKALRWFLVLLGVAIFSHPIATIVDFLLTHNPRATGFGERAIIPYAIFLLLALALSVAMVIYLKGKWRFASCLLVGVSLFGLFANGTRSSILAVGVMAIVAMFFLPVRHKKPIITLGFVLMVGAGVGLVVKSADFSERFNFKKIIEHIGIVWSYAPAEMGRFDRNCFIDYVYSCSPFSGEKLDERFSFEMSALNRLSLWKSAWLAIKENPFRPNGFFNASFDVNLKNIFPIDSLQHPYMQNRSRTLLYYTSAHNMVLSFIFELGIEGFIFILMNFISMLLIIRHKIFEVQTEVVPKVFLVGFFIFLIGVVWNIFFDATFAWSNINYFFFILCGVALGVSCRRCDNGI